MKRKPSTEATAAWIRLMRVQSRVLDAVEQDLKKRAFRRWPGMTRCWNCRAPSGEMRPVELEKQMLIPQYSTSRLIDRLVDEGLAARARMQSTSAASSWRSPRPGASCGKCGRLFGGDQKATSAQTVRCRRHEALRSARPAGLPCSDVKTAAARDGVPAR